MNVSKISDNGWHYTTELKEENLKTYKLFLEQSRKI
jgi:hypothetical protein